MCRYSLLIFPKLRKNLKYIDKSEIVLINDDLEGAKLWCNCDTVLSK